jgi:hypothetical protein
MQRLRNRYGVTPRTLSYFLQLANKNRISMESLWIAKIVPASFEDKEEEDFPLGTLANDFCHFSFPPPLPLSEGKEELPQSTKPSIECDHCESVIACSCPSCYLCLCDKCDKKHSRACREQWREDRIKERKGEKEKTFWITRNGIFPPKFQWYTQLDPPEKTSTYLCDLCKAINVTGCPSCYLCLCFICYEVNHGPNCHTKTRNSRLKSISEGDYLLELDNKAKLEALQGPPVAKSTEDYRLRATSE